MNAMDVLLFAWAEIIQCENEIKTKLFAWGKNRSTNHLQIVFISLTGSEGDRISSTR
jgi:hypothetical protein